MGYTVVSQNNTTTTLQDENGNIVHVPAKTVLATSTEYEISEVNNSTATLTSSDGKVIRGIPCVAVLSGSEGGGGAVSSVNGQTGDVVITGNDVLPDQTGQSGKFLTTDGTDASWSDKPLVNTATGTSALTINGIVSTAQGTINIGNNSKTQNRYSVAIGNGSQTTAQDCTAVGYASKVKAQGGVSLGQQAQVETAANDGIAIGHNVIAVASHSIQLGTDGTKESGGYSTLNSDANTLKVGNANGNFEIMSADGTIPAARHAVLPAADGTYTLQLVIADGVPTLSWVAV